MNAHIHLWVYFDQGALRVRYCKPCDVIQAWVKGKGWVTDPIPFSRACFAIGMPT